MSGKFDFIYNDISDFNHQLTTITDDKLVISIGFKGETPRFIALNNSDIEFDLRADDHKGLYVLINDVLWPVMSIVQDAEMQLPDILRDLEIQKESEE